MNRNRVQLLWSLVFFFGSVALWARVTPAISETTPAPPPAVIQVADVQLFVVDGVWEQYAIDCSGERRFMARLDIRQSGDHYLAHPLSLSASTFPKHAYKLTSFGMQDGTWTFDEEWGSGDIGQFVLQRQPNGEYLGTATEMTSGHSFDTVYVKVSN